MLLLTKLWAFGSLLDSFSGNGAVRARTRRPFRLDVRALNYPRPSPPFTLGWANPRRMCNCRDRPIIFAYRIWALSEKKSWWLCLMILLVSPLYFKYSPDTAPQRVSLWIVLRRQWNIRGCCEYLCGLLPKQCLFQPNLNLHIFLAASDGTPGLQMPWDVDFGTGKSLCQRETYIHGC